MSWRSDGLALLHLPRPGARDGTPAEPHQLDAPCLAAAKARGVKLGNSTNLPVAAAKGRAANMLAADTFAANVLPLVRQMQAGGARTLAELASGLNNRGIQTARGGIWHATTVRNLLGRGVGQ